MTWIIRRFIWPERWGWYKATADPDAPNGLKRTNGRMMAYISAHAEWSEALEKPLVIEAWSVSIWPRSIQQARRAHETTSSGRFLRAYGHMQSGCGVEV